MVKQIHSQLAIPYSAFFALGPRARTVGSHARIFGTTVGYVLNAPRVPVRFSLYFYMSVPRLSETSGDG
jgi:hypothetical protein